MTFCDLMAVSSRDELRVVFDEMIERVFALIDGEIRKLQTSHPGDNIVRTNQTDMSYHEYTN
jgi:hypothetical protein